MAKPPTYTILPHPPASVKSRFLPHAAAVAFGGQVTDMAKAPGLEERTWLKRKKLVSPVPLVGANCAQVTVGSAFSELRACSARHQRKTLASFTRTIARASVAEKGSRYLTTILSSAENLKIGLVAPVTFPFSEVETKWTYSDRKTPQTLDLKIHFDGYHVQGQGHVPVKIRSSWRGLTFDSLAKQIDDGSIEALPWSSYQPGKPDDQLAVSLAPRYHVHIPTLGHVYFAELAMTRYLAMFSLVRLEMGSPFDGTAVITMNAPNGGRW